MPEIDGFELARQIQNKVCRSMVMMLSSDRPGMSCREQLGIASYLVKPIKQSELLMRSGGHRQPVDNSDSLTPPVRLRKSSRSKIDPLAETAPINRAGDRAAGKKASRHCCERWEARRVLSGETNSTWSDGRSNAGDGWSGRDASHRRRENHRSSPHPGDDAHAMKGSRTVSRSRHG